MANVDHFLSLAGISNTFRLSRNDFLGDNWLVSKCEHCGNYIIWFDKKIVYPETQPVQHPNPDMGDDIVKDYLEAASVYQKSPRASAALLRLALQKLCKKLGEPGENINTDIKNLVKNRGLHPTIQQSLDALRIVGNNAVHPGEIDLEEQPELVLKLFGLLNLITDKLITEPQQVESFYASLPQESLEAVERRDSVEAEHKGPTVRIVSR